MSRAASRLDPDATAPHGSVRARGFVLALLLFGVVWSMSRLVGTEAESRGLGVSSIDASSERRSGPRESPAGLGGAPVDGGVRPAGTRSAAAPPTGPGADSREEGNYEITAAVLDSRGELVDRVTASVGTRTVSPNSGHLRFRGEVSELDATSRLRLAGPYGEELWVPGIGERVLGGEGLLELGFVRLPAPVDRTWTGRVVWSDGWPASDVWIGLAATDSELEAWAGDRRSLLQDSPVHYASADEDGGFELTHDLTRPRVIEVQDPLSHLAVEFGPFPPGPLPEVLVLPMDERALTLRCRVVDDRGRPVPGVGVDLWPAAGPSEFPCAGEVRTDEDGFLEVRPVAGTTVLVVRETATTLGRTISAAEALRAGTIVVSRGHRVALDWSGGAYRLIVLEAVDASGAHLGWIASSMGTRRAVLDDLAGPTPVVLVPPGTRALAVHREAPVLSEDTELCRVPFPANPGELERVVVPLGD